MFLANKSHMPTSSGTARMRFASEIAVAVALLLAAAWLLIQLRLTRQSPPLAFGLMATCSTLLGGLAALRLQRWLAALAAFSGGVVVAVAMLLVLRESI